MSLHAVTQPRQERWRRVAEVAWIEHQAMFLALFGVAVVISAGIVVGEATLHQTFEPLVAGQCFSRVPAPACATIMNEFPGKVAPFRAAVIAVRVAPAVVGIFLGAPLFSRMYESGTIQFTWTQGAGRTRFVLVVLGVIAVAVGIASVAIGLLLGWFAHPIEVVGDDSRWSSGILDNTGVMLLGWTMFGLAVGTLAGVVIRRTVAAMAATAAVVGGVIASWDLYLRVHLLGLWAARTSLVSPEGLGFGPLNQAATRGVGPAGSWLVQAEYFQQGRPLDTVHSGEVLKAMDRSASGFVAHPTAWLASHHETFVLTYQPASRLWWFAVIEFAALLTLATALVTCAVVVVRRRDA